MRPLPVAAGAPLVSAVSAVLGAEPDGVVATPFLFLFKRSLVLLIHYPFASLYPFRFRLFMM